ncbi:MAG: menaquinone biosynthesis protein [Bacteroidales bacterium]|nr:menaquinone biosynthesis protein [Bacteroidales bacterium]
MHEGKIRISAVNFANTYPFIYGLTNSGFDKKVILTTDHPAECAAKLAAGEADIGLIPVAALPMLNEYHIITNYCLGAYGKVRTVMLLGNSPLEDIRLINLDYRSRSSVSLARILAKYVWKREFAWRDTTASSDFMNLPGDEALVLIGDLCFEYEKLFSFRIDLAEEWFNHTGLPFAFACWTSNRKLDNSFIMEFNDVLKSGVENIGAVVDMFGNRSVIKGNDLYIYLTRNMSYDLNDDKREAISLFLKMLRNM